ncbi:hypothetical protein V4U86_06260 [Mycobacterium sp. AMU20-3851]|uniref:hypothetical protein n=1 Tax=Mycobacterium sp. AMU20-3851 TaxID=3122055 RepID=UPI00375521CA
MHTALRPFSTAAITLVGAGAIAIAPVAPPLPDIQPRTVSSVEVQLAASSFVNPIAYWGEVLTTTQTSLDRLLTEAGTDPFPVVRQIIANQTGYADMIGTALSSTAEGLVQWTVETIQRRVPEIMTALGQGDLVGAAQVMKFAVTALGIAGFGMVPLLSLPYRIAQNLANVFETMVAVGANTGIIGKPAFGLLNVLNTMIGAVAAVGQEFLDAAKAGAPVSALSTIINAPAFLTDALLNGQKVVLPNGVIRRTTGLLSFSAVTNTAWSLGSALLIHIPRAIAAALAPPAPASTALVNDVAALPSANAQLVLLDAGPTTEHAAGQATAEETSAETTEPPTGGETGTVTEEAPEAETPVSDETEETTVTEELADTETAEGTEDSEETGEDSTGSEDSDISETPDDATDLSGGDTEEPDNTSSGNTTGNGSGLNAGADDDDSDSPAAGNSGAGSGNNSSGNDAGGSNGDSDSGSDS